MEVPGKVAIQRDEGGMKTVRVIGKKVAIMAKTLKSVRSMLEQETDTAIKQI